MRFAAGDGMDFKLTASLVAAAIAAAIFSGWRGAKPFDPHKGPRLIPWRPLMVAFATAALFLLVHLVNLAGVSTGYR
jgi:hypothetical protein